MQVGLRPRCETKHVTFVLRQLHEKYVTKEKNSYFAFIDFDKDFDQF